MRVFILALMTLIVITFTSCVDGKSDDEIKKQCENEGKVFKVEKRLNLRTGEHEKTVYCY